MMNNVDKLICYIMARCKPLPICKPLPVYMYFRFLKGGSHASDHMWS